MSYRNHATIEPRRMRRHLHTPTACRPTHASSRATAIAVRRWRTARSTSKDACAAVDEEQFRIYAAEAETNRPVALALAEIPKIVLTAKLV
jgi:hypothetical protein